jgi:hypothetical protein
VVLDPAVTVCDEGLTLSLKLGLSSLTMLDWESATQTIGRSSAITVRRENAVDLFTVPFLKMASGAGARLESLYGLQPWATLYARLLTGIARKRFHIIASLAKWLAIRKLARNGFEDISPVKSACGK